MRHLAPTLALLVVLPACPKKDEPPEPPKAAVKVEPQAVKPPPAEPQAKPSRVYFAWWSATKAGELVVPESKELVVENPKALTRAFCEKSGALEVAFVARQDGDPDKNDTGMPFDIEVKGDDLRGAKFMVTKGKLSEDERICLLADEAWAKEHAFVEHKDASGDCSAEQKKAVQPLLKGLKSCTRQSAGAELSAFALESDENSGVALMGPSSKVFVELGDPNGEYGSGVLDLVLTFKRKDGAWLAVTCTMAHESITTSLSVVGKDALEEVTSTLYYNAAGG